MIVEVLYGYLACSLGLKSSTYQFKVIYENSKIVSYLTNKLNNFRNEHSTNVFKDIINSLGAFVQNVMLASPPNDPNNEGN